MCNLDANVWTPKPRIIDVQQRRLYCNQVCVCVCVCEAALRIFNEKKIILDRRDSVECIKKNS